MAALWTWCWPEPGRGRMFRSWRHYQWWLRRRGRQPGQQEQPEPQPGRPSKTSRKKGRWRKDETQDQQPVLCKKLTAARRLTLIVLGVLLLLLTCAASANATPDAVLGMQMFTGSLAALEWSRITPQVFRLGRPGTA